MYTHYINVVTLQYVMTKSSIHIMSYSTLHPTIHHHYPSQCLSILSESVTRARHQIQVHIVSIQPPGVTHIFTPLITITNINSIKLRFRFNFISFLLYNILIIKLKVKHIVHTPFKPPYEPYHTAHTYHYINPYH